jgi:hypothetical protein
VDNEGDGRLTNNPVVSTARARTFLPAVLAALALWDAAGAYAGPSALESLCARRLGASAARLTAVWTHSDFQCRLGLAAGTSVGPCPGAAGETAIAPVLERMQRRAGAYCESTCSLSGAVRCVADAMCPPLPMIGAAESCTAGTANRPFDMGRIGFPGPFCPEEIGRDITGSDDIADCVHGLTIRASIALAEAVFGDPPVPALRGSTLACQRAIASRTRRLAVVADRVLTACRNSIVSGTRKANPADCPRIDSTFVSRTALLENKLAAAVDAACSAEDILALDLCGAGRGGITTKEEALACLTTAAREIVASEAAPDHRAFSRTTLLDAAYPPAPRCGDGRVNQLTGPFLPLGEECDGTDDAACPGACIPPGDLFECSCADRPRLQLLVESARTDLDQGWTGSALDATLPEGSGFVMELSACDCTEMDGAACTGSSVDPVCTVAAQHMPRCSWDSANAPRCDARGNGNLLDEDKDCWMCDDWSLNAGAACSDESQCAPRCYDADGEPANPCPRGQTDCDGNQVCRGRCDRQHRCLATALAPPSPVANGGSPICLTQFAREDLTGTTNVVTGEHAFTQRTRVYIHLGLALTVPCPVCGGLCEGGAFPGDVCTGTCSTTRSSCRFDDDCPAGEFCSSSSPDCPGGACNLALICRGGASDGQPCRIQSETRFHGTVSGDCPPSIGTNISGNGLLVDYAPATSEPSRLSAPVPCTAPGYELFDCPCPDDGGRKTQPNACAPACNAGPELGMGCADGNNATGRFTTCAGGLNAGRACDANSDCPGSSCSTNPRHCTGDQAFLRVACQNDGDCGVGSCVNACPGGRCVPLCMPRDDDPEEGICAAGPPVYRCDGPLDAFRTCGRSEAEGSCDAVCEKSLTPCTAAAQCPPGEACIGSCVHARSCEAGYDGVLGTTDDLVGAGVCVEKPGVCPLDPIEAEGGDVWNGRGGPSQPLSVATFCLGRTNAPAVNTVVGVGGPGRLRRAGRYATNGFSGLP